MPSLRLFLQHTAALLLCPLRLLQQTLPLLKVAPRCATTSSGAPVLQWRRSLSSGWASWRAWPVSLRRCTGRAQRSAAQERDQHTLRRPFSR